MVVGGGHKGLERPHIAQDHRVPTGLLYTTLSSKEPCEREIWLSYLLGERNALSRQAKGLF